MLHLLYVGVSKCGTRDLHTKAEISLSLSLSLSQQRKTKTKRPTNLNLKSCFLYSFLKILPLFILKHKK